MKTCHEVSVTAEGDIRVELWREENGTKSDRAVYYFTPSAAGDVADSLNFAVQDSDPKALDPDFYNDLKIEAPL